MKYEKRHYAYQIAKGGYSTPAENMINELGDATAHYVGTYSEYNPIAMERCFPSQMCAIVTKRQPDNGAPMRDFKLPGYVAGGYGGYHSSEFNCNGGLVFSKEDLLRIAHAMDYHDELAIVVPDSLNAQAFQEDIKKVTK